MSNLRWLHLSDIHFNFNNHDTVWLRDRLLIKLKEYQGQIDFLVVTGDLLFQFGASFEGVEDFLNDVVSALQVSIDNVFIVPGNHDFRRDEMRTILIDGIKKSEKDVTTKVSDLGDVPKNMLISNGQKAFWEFHQKILNRKDNHEDIHFLNEREQFNIVNLNTCIISGVKNEEGTLSIGMSQLMKVLKDIQDIDKPIIAIGHHSLECFIESERTEIAQIFEDYNVDIYLCGHMHKSEFVINSKGERPIRSLVCGANMTDNYADPTFIVGDLDLDTFECSVIFYKWMPNSKKWRTDYDVDRKVLEDGSLNFKFDRFIKKKELNKNIDTKDELMDKQIEQMLQENIKQDKFQLFLISFCENIKGYDGEGGTAIVNIDVPNKFENMRCCPTFQFEFDGNVEYFNILDNILADPSYIYYERKTLIPGVIKSKYKEVYKGCKDGSHILEIMSDELAREYSKILNIPFRDLKEYFKTIIFWSLNKCDIYNECI